MGNFDLRAAGGERAEPAYNLVEMWNGLSSRAPGSSILL